MAVTRLRQVNEDCMFLFSTKAKLYKHNCYSLMAAK